MTMGKLPLRQALFIVGSALVAMGPLIRISRTNEIVVGGMGEMVFTTQERLGWEVVRFFMPESSGNVFLKQ